MQHSDTARAQRMTQRIGLDIGWTPSPWPDREGGREGGSSKLAQDPTLTYLAGPVGYLLWWPSPAPEAPDRISYPQDPVPAHRLPVSGRPNHAYPPCILFCKLAQGGQQPAGPAATKRPRGGQILSASISMGRPKGTWPVLPFKAAFDSLSKTYAFRFSAGLTVSQDTSTWARRRLGRAGSIQDGARREQNGQVFPSLPPSLPPLGLRDARK